MPLPDNEPIDSWDADDDTLITPEDEVRITTEPSLTHVVRSRSSKVHVARVFYFIFLFLVLILSFLFLSKRCIQDMDVDGEDGSDLPKALKRKPPKPEESKSKKEHINVVFIGHVGEFIFAFFIACLPACMTSIRCAA